MWRELSAEEFRTAFGKQLPDDFDGRRLQPFLVREDQDFEVRSRSRRIGTATVSINRLSPFKTTSVRSQSVDVLHIGFVLRGSFAIEIDQVPLSSVAPVPYVLPSWEAISIECSQPVQGIDIAVTASRLASRGVRLQRREYGLLSAHSAIPLRLFAGALLDAPPPSSMSAIDVLATDRALDDLLVGALLAERIATNGSTEFAAGLLLQATSHIRAYHRDQELTPQLVADALSVSLRHLQRAFAAADLSVAVVLANCRADSAALLLAGAVPMRLDEVACRSGFRSTHELRVAFRRRYGVLPSAFTPR